MNKGNALTDRSAGRLKLKTIDEWRWSMEGRSAIVNRQSAMRLLRVLDNQKRNKFVSIS